MPSQGNVSGRDSGLDSAANTGVNTGDATGLARLNQSQICDCFNELFGSRLRVQLRGGGAEPDYLPATANTPAEIIAREDFAASALHEAAHWCVASRERRALPDYGYTYISPPRGDAGQQAFFAAEKRVQATEWYLSRRAGLPFRASADDPDFCLGALERFQAELAELVDAWEDTKTGMQPPLRAVEFGEALRVVATAAAGSTDQPAHKLVSKPASPN